MKVRVSPNLLQFIQQYLRDFWGKVKRSSGQLGRVHTAGDSDLSLRSEQRDVSVRLVCSSVSVDLTLLFKWHKRAAGLRHFRPPPNVVLDPVCKNVWTLYMFFPPKIDLDTIWMCKKKQTDMTRQSERGLGHIVRKYDGSPSTRLMCDRVINFSQTTC